MAMLGEQDTEDTEKRETRMLLSWRKEARDNRITRRRVEELKEEITMNTL